VQIAQNQQRKFVHLDQNKCSARSGSMRAEQKAKNYTTSERGGWYFGIFLIFFLKMVLAAQNSLQIIFHFQITTYTQQLQL